MKRIAVWNTAFLGDAVLTLPLLQSLALRYPGASIDFYVRGGLEPLFSNHPALNAVYGFDKRGRQKSLGSLLAFAREAAARRYDLWISAHSSMRSAVMARVSGAPLRIGYATSFLKDACYSRVVSRRFEELEEVERLLELLRPLGEGAVSMWPCLMLDKEAYAAAEAFFTSHGGPFLGIHPGSVWATKRWPAAYFADVGERALRAGASVLLFAGPGEEHVALAVKGMLADSGAPLERLHDFSGRLSLPLLAAYLGKLDCYLSNDSGPMHLAWAQLTPVAAVFGPTVRSLGFFPRGRGSSVYEADEACRPCGLHGHASCPLGHHRCMSQVTPDVVWADVERKLSAGRQAFAADSAPCPSWPGQEL